MKKNVDTKISGRKN